jgi:KaiC/GvpD/RAD55 family RecA-like ATPase
MSEVEGINPEQTLQVPILSDILGHPIARGKVFVILYEPSTQWNAIILTMASTLLRGGFAVGIITLTTPPSEIRRQLTTVLSNVRDQEASKGLTIIDWYTWMTGRKSAESRSVDSLTLAQFNVQDSRFQRADSPLYDFLVSDNLSAFLKYNDERAFMQWLDKTIARMRETKGVRLYGFMKHFHSDAFYANLEAMADGVIDLEIRERRGRLKNVIRLKSMKGLQHATEWRTLTVTASGLIQLNPRRR